MAEVSSKSEQDETLAPDLANEVTLLLQKWQSGDQNAADRLIERVYPELRRMAGAYFSRERDGHSLPPTALVNELYLKLISASPPVAQSRAHFLAIASQVLRHILVDYARAHGSLKRGGGAIRVSLTDADLQSEHQADNLISIHEALVQLEKLDARAAKVVELRFFGALPEEEVASILKVSRNTVKRDWRTARAWLMSRLTLSKTSVPE